MATEPISDVEAFWRLKESPRRLDSYQAIRTVAFCLEFQRAGGSIARVVASGRYGRRTAFNRQSSCRAAGFEPGQVRFVVHTEDFWAEEDRAQVALIETFYRQDVDSRAQRRMPLRLLRRRPERYQDPLEED